MHTAGSNGEVICVDCHYQGVGRAAAYLLVEQGHALFVDTNTVHAVPHLLDALRAQGLAPESVDYIIPTHVHLDHAGGAWRLAEACPNAAVLAHPRAVPHLANPARLEQAVRAVYGDALFARLYAPLQGIPNERLRPVEDEEILIWRGRTLRFLHTRGHANHHLCVYDRGANAVFTGDTLGIDFHAARKSRRPYIRYSSAPSDFDPLAAESSIARLLATGAERAYVAHFGELRDLGQGMEVLRESLVDLGRLYYEALGSELDEDGLIAFCREGVRNAIEAHIVRCGVEDPGARPVPVMRNPELDAQGLAAAVRRVRARGG